jgi:hypothetical protein
MHLRSLIVASSLILAVGYVAPAHAADQPISGMTLKLKRSGSKQKLVFVSKDPGFLFPAIGSGDDPTTAGLTVELFSAGLSGEGAALGAPAGAGWRETTSPPRYLYGDAGAAPGGVALSRVVMRGGKVLRITAPGTGLSLAGPEGSIGIRITSGSTRSCALFAGAAVRKDVAGTFIGKNAPASALGGCSTAELAGVACATSGAPECAGFCPPGSACGTDLSSCFCISGAQPCGDTSPTCNGECPAGEECGSIGGLLLPDCACLPAGSTPCGGTSPTCDGDCPAGTSCFGVSFPLPGGGQLNGCQCLTGPPVDPCGGCPPGFTCFAGPPFGSPFCLAFCNGPSGAPVCDGTCPGGVTCNSVSDLCLCFP